MKAPLLVGYAARFETPEALLAAVHQFRSRGYSRLDAFSPFSIEGMDNELGFHGHSISWLTAIGGLTGAITGFGLQYYASVLDYPIRVAGRPPNSWPAFIPVTFELTILCAALAGVLGMLLLNGLPQLHHAMMDVPGFESVTRDGYFLWIDAHDPLFDDAHTRSELENLNPLRIEEVIAEAEP